MKYFSSAEKLTLASVTVISLIVSVCVLYYFFAPPHQAGFALGYSMSKPSDVCSYRRFVPPVLMPGSILVIDTSVQPQLCDVVCYTRDDKIVCHELIKIFTKDGVTYYQTKGTALRSPDDPFPADKLIGVAVDYISPSIFTYAVAYMYDWDSFYLSPGTLLFYLMFAFYFIVSFLFVLYWPKRKYYGIALLSVLVNFACIIFGIMIEKVLIGLALSVVCMFYLIKLEDKLDARGA